MAKKEDVWRKGYGAIGLLGVMLTTCAGCGAPVDHPEIRAVLDGQASAWNRGDLEGFMRGYWRSDELVFSSPTGETRGWTATLERYRQSYPTREKMGQLSFENLRIARPSEDQAEVSGRYRLKRSDGVHAGRFYLKMRRTDGAWVIVRDRTVGD
jgi:ketosteroid isomerase-like protein